MIKQMVMLIDDDDVSNFIGRSMITKAEIVDEVISCNSAEDSLRYLKENAADPALLPKLIFLDINMPVKDGWDFLEEYKLISKEYEMNIPIIMLTSSLYQQDIERAETYPEVREFTSKPLSIKYLKEVCQKHL